MNRAGHSKVGGGQCKVLSAEGGRDRGLVTLKCHNEPKKPFRINRGVQKMDTKRTQPKPFSDGGNPVATSPPLGRGLLEISPREA